LLDLLESMAKLEKLEKSSKSSKPSSERVILGYSLPQGADCTPRKSQEEQWLWE